MPTNERQDHTLLKARRSVCQLILITAVAALAGCTNGKGDDEAGAAGPAPVAISAGEAVERPIRRFLRVTGTLAAEEEAEVAAETTGRVVATPVERGTLVQAGSDLVRIATTEVAAQAAEAEANAAQIEARLGLEGEAGFDIERVPEVANALAARSLAEADFDRARMLFERKLLSTAEFDQRSSQAQVARRQYDIARNGAVQQYQALLAARARVTLARKAVSDTVVRAPFAGVVGQRLVSVGDYVTRGTKVASVLRANPLRVELTVPEQYSAEVAVGRPVSLQLDAHPGQTFTGQVRYVSPEVRADSRALIVEAVVANANGMLKPGSFVTAQVEQASRRPAILVPADAVRTVAGTARVYIVAGDRVEERIVTTGQPVDDMIEIATGLKAGEQVATTGVAQLSDGVRVAVR